jgi:L-rhamnose isomerase
VVLLNDELLALAQEVKRSQAFAKVNFALDFFDASINRITAWVTGTRALQKALLIALLEPTALLAEAESQGNLGHRLALAEEFKTLPYGAVWNQYCMLKNVPAGSDWLQPVANYERDILVKRG